MSTILMRTDLLADARVFRIVSLTRVDKMRVIGGLYWLWSVAQTQSNDGVIQCMTEELLDEQVGLPGFARALVSVGWLTLQEDTVTIPDFDSYFGKSSKTRAKERLKKARQRWNKKGKGDTKGTGGGQEGDKKGTQGGHKGDKEGTASGHVGTAERSGADRSGSKPSESDPIRAESIPPVASVTGSANRFIADRQIRTGNTPPGFLEFYNAYPTGFKADRDGLLALWNAQGLESDAQAILEGLAAWIVCERWREGFIVEARKFIETKKWRDAPPPPKPVTKPQFGGGAF